MKSHRERRPPHLLWWAVFLVLILAGILGFVFHPHSKLVGPVIRAPIGNVTLPPSGIVIPAPTTTTMTESADPDPGSATALLAAYAVRGPKSTTPTVVAHSAVTSPVYVAKPVGRSRPIHLSIPKLGLSVSLSVLGLNANGTVQVPTNFEQPGWYKFGPAPGQRGSAVILGHVDSKAGPAVFVSIDSLQLGNRVNVTLQNGKHLQFAVIGVRMFLKTDFPRGIVYGPRKYPALQLVTCGGVFDPVTGHYLSNIVVFTALVKS